MFTSRYLNNTLNEIHERALRLIYNDYKKSFLVFLTKLSENYSSKSLEFPAFEIYKFQNGLSPSIKSDVFILRQNIYNVWNFHGLFTSAKDIVKISTEILYMTTIIELNSWKHKNVEPTLELFKKIIKNGNVNPVHVECAKPMCNIQAWSVNKNMSFSFANGSY